MQKLNLVLLLLALTSLAQANIVCDWVSNREYNTHAYSAASGGTNIYIKCSGIPAGADPATVSVKFLYTGASFGYQNIFNCNVQSVNAAGMVHCITEGSGEGTAKDRLNPALRDSEWMNLQLSVSGSLATINSVYHSRINYKFSYDGYVKYVSPQGFVNGVKSNVNIRGALRTSNSNDVDIRFVGSVNTESQNDRYQYDNVDDKYNGYICSTANGNLLAEDEVEENDDDTGVNYLQNDPLFDHLEIPTTTNYNFWSEYNYKCQIYPRYIRSTYFRLNIRTQAINLQDFPNLRYDNEEFKIFPAVTRTKLRSSKPALYISRQSSTLRTYHVKTANTRLCISPSDCYKVYHGSSYFQFNSLESNNLKDTTESTFLKGAGLIYQRWKRNGESNLDAVRTKILGKQTNFEEPEEIKIATTWEEISIPTNEIVSFQGYIHAPVSGEYTFELAGDDRALFLLNKTPGEPLVDTSDATKHFRAYRGAHGSFRNPSYNRNYVTSNNADNKNFSVTLEGGKYYYAEMYGLNYGSAGHVSLQATYPIPNKHGHSTADNLNRYRQFQDTIFEYKIQTNAVLYYRKFKITCTSGTNCGQQQFNFKVQGVDQTEQINFPVDNDSIYTFRDEIRQQFKNEIGYTNLNIWVDSLRTDSNGKPYTQVHIRGDSGIEPSLEGANTLQFQSSSLDGVIVSSQEQNWDITGSYQLKVDGKNLQNNGSNDWAYDTHGNYIYKAIIQDLGYQYQFTTVQTYGNRVTGYTIQIFIRQNDGDTTAPNVFEITHNLQNEGQPCTIDWNTLQQKDRNRIINYGMFDENYIASTQPTLFLKYQRQADVGLSVPSLYLYSSTKTVEDIDSKHIPIFFGNSKVVVNSATLNQDTNTLTVSLDHQNPIDNTDIIEEMYILHNGQKVDCAFSKPVANLNNIICQLEKYPSIGTYKLAVVFTKTQKVEYVDANIDITYKFKVLGLDKNQAPASSSTAVTVYFHPFDITYCSFTTLIEKITFVDPDSGKTADCQFHQQDLSDTTYNGQPARSITCTVDPVGNDLDTDTPHDVVVDTNDGDTDDSQDFTFVEGGDPSPELTDVTPKHWTPVQKGILNIAGTNLPTDKTKYLVKLLRRTTEPGDIQTDMSRYKGDHSTYILPVTAVTSTNIEANLGGGVTGTFDIEVFYDNTPLNKQNNFYFEYRIAIRDIQYPGAGSKYGGQTVIITGDNFSDKDVFDNNIFFHKRYTDAVGRIHDINEQCLVVDRGNDNSKEEIVCKAPALPDVVENSPTGFDVIIQGRLIEESICRMPENCHLNNPPTCSCKYDYAAVSPKVVVVEEANAATIASGDTAISIAATNIPVGSVQLLFKGFGVYTATRVSDTEITFDAPTDIDRGFYNVLVITSQGYAGVVPFNYVSTVSSVDGPTSQSTKGAILTLNGSGFRATDFVKVGSTVCQIVSRSQSQIVFLSPARNNGVTESIKLFQLNDNGSSTEVLTANTISYSNGKTPQATTCGSSSTSICSTSDITIDAISSFKYNLQESSLSQFSSVSNVSAALRVDSDKSRTYAGVIVVSGGEWQITFNNVPVGIYNLELHDSDNGFAKITTKTKITINFPAANTITNFGPISLIGGKELTVTSTVGFDSNLENSEVFVCGYQAEVTSATFNQLTFVSPNIYSNWIDETQTVGSDEIDMVEDKPYYTYQQEDIRGDLIGDYPNISVKKRIQDGNDRTYYVHHGSDDCWVGYDYGEERRVRVSQIVFETSSIHYSQEYKLLGAEIQGSIDGSTWTTLFEIQEEVISGQNVYNAPYAYNPELDREFDRNYRYVRFYKSTNWCVISSFKVNGFQSSILEPLQTPANSAYINQQQVCKVQIEINGNKLYADPANSTFLKTTYQLDTTPRIWSLNKYYGPIQGGTQVTLTGKQLFKDNASKTKVFLDGVECAVSSVTATEIVCTTGVKANDSTHPREIRVEVDGVIAAVRDGVVFFYGLEWTNALTWGGDHFPQDLDSIWVPKGQTLIIDFNAPSGFNLNTIVNEGTIVVADDADINLNAINIINRKSEFYVGTKLIQHSHTLVMTLSGSDYFARNQRHLPVYGNNAFVCHECTLVLNGKNKQHTWANVSAQIEAGSTTINYDHSEYPKIATQWNVNDRIVIGTTSFNSNENEVRIISAISEGVITVSEAIEFQHIKNEEVGNGSTKLFVNTPIGNLSRNIIFSGADAEDQDSPQNQDYGAHMYIYGLNASTRIANVEFQKTGQASIMERFSLTYNTVRGLNDNKVVKCSFDRSYARGINLRDSRYVTIYRNVFYGVRGHNVGLTSGTEMYNEITQNLIVAPRSAANLYQTDVTVAGIQLANPYNYVNGNHIVGSQFYGIQYELPTKPHGFHTSSLCPQGMKIGSLNNNEIHSNLGYGLFINNLRPRKYPCKATRSSDYKDPWAANPQTPITLNGQQIYKNKKVAILGYELGNLVLNNFVLFDNVRAGFQVHLTNDTEHGVVFKNGIIVCKSGINGAPNELHTAENTAGVITPRTDGLTIESTYFRSFFAGTTVIAVASENYNEYVRIQGGKTVFIKSSFVISSTGAGLVRYIGPATNLVVDLTGDFTQTSQPTYITRYYQHHAGVVSSGKCTRSTSSSTDKYDDSVLCTQTQLKPVMIGNLQKHNYFQQRWVKIFDLSDPSLDADNASHYTSYRSVYIRNKRLDCRWCYPMILPVDRTFNVHWDRQLDFKHLMIYPVYRFEETAGQLALRFNHTINRELWNVYSRQEQVSGSNLVHTHVDIGDIVNTASNSAPVAQDWGNYHHDQSNRHLYVSLNQQASRFYQSIDIDGIYCKLTCASLGGRCGDVNNVQHGDYDKLKNHAWGFNRAHVATRDAYSQINFIDGHDLWIKCDQVLTLSSGDVLLASDILIDGKLIVNSGATIKTTNIWVRYGEMHVGNGAYVSDVLIEFTKSSLNSELLVPTQAPGERAFVVSNLLTMTGKYPEISNVRLYSSYDAGATRLCIYSDVDILVPSESKYRAWQADDRIGLGGSLVDGTGHEEVEISGNIAPGAGANEYCFDIKAPTQFYHYGSDQPSFTNAFASSAAFNDDDDDDDDDDDVLPLVTVQGHVHEDLGFDYRQSIDMRTTVQNLNRGIKIIDTTTENAGVHMLVHFEDNTVTVEGNEIVNEYSGVLRAEGVEFSFVGRPNTENAGLYFNGARVPKDNTPDDDNDVQSSDYNQFVRNSSFSKCRGMCVNMYRSSRIDFNNNSLFKGEQFLFKALHSQNLNVKYNYFVGVYKDQFISHREPETLIYMWSVRQETDNVFVKNNVGQSSTSLGFNFPTNNCDENISGANAFVNNEVGNVGSVGVIWNINKSECEAVGSVAVYHAKIGAILNTYRVGQIAYVAKHVLIAECQKGLILRSDSILTANDRFTHYIQFLQSFIASKLFDDNTLYVDQPDAFKCSGQYGMQLLLTNRLGNSHPITYDPIKFESIETIPIVFANAYIKQVTFYNYRATYTGASVCSNNVAFKTNENAAEVVPPHYLTDTRCIDCEESNFFKFDDPKESWLGLEGGCGTINCTGLKNALIQEVQSTVWFPDQKAYSVISKNEEVASYSYLSDKCVFVASWNGYKCDTDDLTVISWESIGPDYNRLTPYPVNVTVKNDADTYEKFNTLNMWKEWDYAGDSPLNKRRSTFTTLGLINRIHNIAYSGQQSYDMVFKMTNRYVPGDSNSEPTPRRTVVRQYYPSPLTVQVSILGATIEDRTIVPSYAISDPQDLTTVTATEECGLNNYLFEEQVIEFVLNSNANCLVRVELVNHVQVNMRIGMTKEQFYSDTELQTNFINRIAALLGITWNRVKIVGIRDDTQVAGSRILQESKTAKVEVRITSQERIQTKAEGYTGQKSYLELKQLGAKLQQEIAEDKNVLEIPVVEVEETKVVVSKEAGADIEEDQTALFQESDVVIDPDTDGNNGGNGGSGNGGAAGGDNQTLDKKKSSKSGSPINIMILAAIGLGVVIFVLIAVIAYHCYKKKSGFVKRTAPKKLTDTLSQRYLKGRGSVISVENIDEKENATVAMSQFGRKSNKKFTMDQEATSKVQKKFRNSKRRTNTTIDSMIDMTDVNTPQNLASDRLKQ